MKCARLAPLACVLAATGAWAGAALAAGGIEIRRGPDRVEFGSCVPSLAVENKSGETIDYLEVDLAIALADGRRRTVELKSAYREGIHYPIEPGGKAVLRQHLDTEASLGVPCGEVKSRAVARTICEATDGKPCTAKVSIQP
ncbi:MAG TPA: hypothetical protein VFB13_04075 [Reyranella sp.]|jgi:hypothetical protein|nr:hypothetical protein [Reyranella sp.]